MSFEVVKFLFIGFFVFLFVIGWWFSIKIMREQWSERNKIRKSNAYKDKGYFRFYWEEQKRLIKKQFSTEYKTEAILGVALTLMYVSYGIYAFFSYPELATPEGISDPSNPIFFEVGCLMIITGVFYIIKGYLAVKRGRTLYQSIEADPEATPVNYKTSVYSSIFGGITFIFLGIVFTM